MLRIVADQNIPHAKEAFSNYGDLTLLPGREITPEAVRDADALIVRSITKVDEALLTDSAVRFVGTATVGTDHIDTEFLRKSGIRFISAAGCNARSVVEYVLTALAEFCADRREDWEGKTLGIIGYGNIGTRLAVRARGVGMHVLVCDPPLAEIQDEHEDDEFLPMSWLLRECDFLTLHVPYTTDGRHATHHLIGREELTSMKPGAVLINTSRGPVVDNEAAQHAQHIELILDVFEGEPEPNEALVNRCFLATPHIAGYSYEGKVNGTRMMALGLARFLNRQDVWSPELPPPADREIALAPADSVMEAVLQAMRVSYPIREDDRKMRAIYDLPPGPRGKAFDDARKNYPRRREFANYVVTSGASDDIVLSRLRVLHLMN